MLRIVITGGPGSGKTTLLRELQARGYEIVGDSPRSIIQDRTRRGLSPRPHPLEFAQQILRLDIQKYDQHEANRGPVFFDRSVLDALCSLDTHAPLGRDDLAQWILKYPYSPTAFILPPWKEIYVNDAERDHEFEHAEAVYGITQYWYRRCGYQLTEVPMISACKRAEYVLQTIADDNI